MRTLALGASLLLALTGIMSPVSATEGDPARGQRVFRVCGACHTLTPGWHRTGPSLAGVWGRRSASVADFSRYSTALMQSNLVWNGEMLDAWLADPQRLVPGNGMVFGGIDEPQARADLIAYLRVASARPPPARSADGRTIGGLPDLKQSPPAQAVKAIRHCRDTYRVTTQAGAEIAFWEYNLRFKTDTSPAGPQPGRPVFVPAGMRGDRAQIVFSSPTEISTFINSECPQ